jgi:hypothetical protein
MAPEVDLGASDAGSRPILRRPPTWIGVDRIQPAGTGYAPRIEAPACPGRRWWVTLPDRDDRRGPASWSPRTAHDAGRQWLLCLGGRRGLPQDGRPLLDHDPPAPERAPAVQVMAHNLARWTARIGLGGGIVTTKTLRRRLFGLVSRRPAHPLGSSVHAPPAGPLAVGDELYRRARAAPGDPAPRLTGRGQLVRRSGAGGGLRRDRTSPVHRVSRDLIGRRPTLVRPC